MAKYRIIVNPVAGRGAAERAIPRVEEMLQEYGLHVDLVRTERPWHAVELAQESVRAGCDVVVAMGGDGTANEVINGLMRAKDDSDRGCALGVLCIGRGNDFAYGVGIPSGLEEGCRILARGEHRTIDVGRVVVDDGSECRYFGNGVGIGFDAVVGFEALRIKRLSGLLCYGVAALKTIFLYFTAPVVRMEYNGKTHTQPSLMVSVMNGRRMGGGFQMAPEAKSDDGRFDLCVAGEVSRLRIFTLILRFLRGTQAGKKPITTDRTSKIAVTAVEGVLPAHADGETLCTAGRRLAVEVLPGRLEVVC